MARKGISLSMSYVVIGLILLTTAFAIVTFFVGGIDQVSRIVGVNLGQSERDVVRQYCMNRKPVACQGYSSGEDGWANDVIYNGTSCYQWQQDQQIFGDEIPTC